MLAHSPKKCFGGSLEAISVSPFMLCHRPGEYAMSPKKSFMSGRRSAESPGRNSSPGSASQCSASAIHAGPGQRREFGPHSRYVYEDDHSPSAPTFGLGSSGSFRVVDISKMNEGRHSWCREDSFLTPAGLNATPDIEDAPPSFQVCTEKGQGRRQRGPSGGKGPVVAECRFRAHAFQCGFSPQSLEALTKPICEAIVGHIRPDIGRGDARITALEQKIGGFLVILEQMRDFATGKVLVRDVDSQTDKRESDEPPLPPPPPSDKVLVRDVDSQTDKHESDEHPLPPPPPSDRVLVRDVDSQTDKHESDQHPLPPPPPSDKESDDILCHLLGMLTPSDKVLVRDVDSQTDKHESDEHPLPPPPPSDEVLVRDADNQTDEHGSDEPPLPPPPPSDKVLVRDVDSQTDKHESDEHPLPPPPPSDKVLVRDVDSQTDKHESDEHPLPPPPPSDKVLVRDVDSQTDKHDSPDKHESDQHPLPPPPPSDKVLVRDVDSQTDKHESDEHPLPPPPPSDKVLVRDVDSQTDKHESDEHPLPPPPPSDKVLVRDVDSQTDKHESDQYPLPPPPPSDKVLVRDVDSQTDKHESDEHPLPPPPPSDEVLVRDVDSQTDKHESDEPPLPSPSQAQDGDSQTDKVLAQDADSQTHRHGSDEPLPPPPCRWQMICRRFQQNEQRRSTRHRLWKRRQARKRWLLRRCRRQALAELRRTAAGLAVGFFNNNNNNSSNNNNKNDNDNDDNNNNNNNDNSLASGAGSSAMEEEEEEIVEWGGVVNANQTSVQNQEIANKSEQNIYTGQHVHSHGGGGGGGGTTTVVQHREQGGAIPRGLRALVVVQQEVQTCLAELRSIQACLLKVLDAWPEEGGWARLCRFWCCCCCNRRPTKGTITLKVETDVGKVIDEIRLMRKWLSENMKDNDSPSSSRISFFSFCCKRSKKITPSSVSPTSGPAIVIPSVTPIIDSMALRSLEAWTQKLLEQSTNKMHSQTEAVRVELRSELGSLRSLIQSLLQEIKGPIAQVAGTQLAMQGIVVNVPAGKRVVKKKQQQQSSLRSSASTMDASPQASP
ncbi:unnamed protein product [Polarella glacialis]|uniref:Uncharacterized protein n=1 Tax=Polarella glacialis TaxID=89957 RepID=A0A813I569_POLGL|nr:unnamed protein product [Polarella glacialis]